MADYAHYGNPLKELEIDEAPKKFKDETVRDEKGRRRFHGAFTGGFSAGYFNSVDTKEGWTPTQFISTRSNRANKSEQKPQDYMDNEDLGELGFAPQRLQLQEGARIIPGESQSTSSHAGVGSQRELLSAPLKRILKGDRDSVGVMILREMGWRDGKGIGPKVCLRAGYGPQLPPFLADAEVGPDDIELTEIKGTDKVWGLGYTPETRLDLFSEKIDRERLTQTTAKVGGRRLDIRGQAFGVGAFEEDDEDIYAKDDMTQYAFEEVDHSRGDRSRTPKLPMIESGKKKDKGGLLEGFVAVEVHVSSSPASSKPVVVPPDWKPTPLAEQSQKIKAELTREQKVASLFHSLPEGSVFNFLSEDARAKIEATKKALIERKKQSEETSRLTSEPADELSLEAREGSIGEDGANRTYGVVDVTTLRPFAKDPNKQERFDRFVAFAEKGHCEMLASIQPPHFSGWEAALEKKEFEAALAIVRPKLGLKNRFEDNQAEDNPHAGLPTGLASASDMPKPCVVPVAEESRGPPIRPLKDFGSRTHARFVWHPASVLCKRFNIPDPYPGQEFVGIPDSSLHLDQPQAEAAEQRSQGQQEGLQDSDLPSTSRTEIPKRSAPAFTAKTRIDDSAVEPEREKTPPAIDIFKMIFSDEEEEESNEQAEVTRENASPDSKTRQTGTAPVVETERKNTGIFANIDLSLLNKRPPPKALASSEARKAAVQEIEQPLVPMGPRPPPILAIETETVQKFMSKKDKKKHKLKDKKRKKDSKSKKKKTKKKKEKHRKRKKGDTSSASSESETSSSEEEHDEKVSRKTGRRKKRKRTKEHPKHRSSSSSSEDSDNGSDEERVDKRLKKKLKNLRSPL